MKQQYAIFFFIFFTAISLGVQPLYADAVTDAQAAVADAEADLANAQAALSRAETAAASAEAAVADAESALAQAKANLADAQAAAEEPAPADPWAAVSGPGLPAAEDEAAVQAAATETAAPSQTPDGTLPAAYTVRSWTEFKDCFWTIAGYPFVYGNSHQWRRLYEANRSKLADPNNPNVIEEGTVLDIPSIRGEVRQGVWGGGSITTDTGVSDTVSSDTEVSEPDAVETNAVDTDDSGADASGWF